MAKRPYEKPVVVSKQSMPSRVEGISDEQWNDPDYLQPPRYVVESAPDGVDWGALPRVAVDTVRNVYSLGGEAGVAALRSRGVKLRRASFADVYALRKARASQ